MKQSDLLLGIAPDSPGERHRHETNAIGNITTVTTTVGVTSYGYENDDHPHALTHIDGVERCRYNVNGSMFKRKRSGAWQRLAHDHENRLTSVSGPVNATFLYDAEGRRVWGKVDGTKVVYMGDWYEWWSTTGASYYHFNGRRVAMRVGDDVRYLHADHLNSNVRTTGAVSTGPQYYYPYGAMRGGSQVRPAYRFTGQKEEAALGLYYYKARWYDPELRRFIQPDPIEPEPGSPQAFNRYSYVLNNPVRYTDPSGYEPRQPRGEDTAWSYILREMKTNARSLRVSAIAVGNMGANSLRSSAHALSLRPDASAWPAAKLAGDAALASKATSYALWAEKVGPGRDWDHKPPIARKFEGRQSIPGMGVADFDTWSNIHYGFVGVFAGFGSLELFAGAGIVQLLGSGYEAIKLHEKTGYTEALLAGEVGIHTFFDWPGDQTAIALGIYMAHTYGMGLTAAQLLYEVNSWGLTHPHTTYYDDASYYDCIGPYNDSGEILYY